MTPALGLPSQELAFGFCGVGQCLPTSVLVKLVHSVEYSELRIVCCQGTVQAVLWVFADGPDLHETVYGMVRAWDRGGPTARCLPSYSDH